MIESMRHQTDQNQKRSRNNAATPKLSSRSTRLSTTKSSMVKMKHPIESPSSQGTQESDSTTNVLGLDENKTKIPNKMLRVFQCLTYVQEELNWAYVLGHTSVHAIVNDACSNRNDIANLLLKGNHNNKEYQDFIIKTLMIGRYFYDRKFPNDTRNDWTIDETDFPFGEQESELFIDQHYDQTSLRRHAR